MHSLESWGNGLASFMLPSLTQSFLGFDLATLKVLVSAGAYERSFRDGLLYLAFTIARWLLSSSKPVSTHCAVTAFLPNSSFFLFFVFLSCLSYSISHHLLPVMCLLDNVSSCPAVSDSAISVCSFFSLSFVFWFVIILFSCFVVHIFMICRQIWGMC